MKHIKLYEGFSEEESPNYITLAFNGRIGLDEFKDQYWPKLGKDGYYAQIVTQESGFVSNWNSLRGDGEESSGKDGLIMKGGVYYPLFKVYDERRSSKGEWIYLSYSKEDKEILIIASREHSDRGKEIEREISENPQGKQWYTKFNKIEPGEVDNRGGYFKIISVN